MGNKKVSVHVQQTDDKCFSIELDSGLFQKKHFVSETVDSLLAKVSAFLKSEFAGGKP